ncbi:ADP-ribosylglycohydrolase family protein [Anaerotignum sp.]|uniref:ADP-ribosylglycohydrolase family protein n=1 Tax=Anaerotignum sp. TaxID=2039241 RepID=UPI00289EE794|nr:ADP-ribosylglycohydrolase family protein [Anaerotignum sp.]
MKDIDKFNVCLIGGAAGNALEYAVEFLDSNTIFQKYYQHGITEYSLVNGETRISDDIVK